MTDAAPSVVATRIVIRLLAICFAVCLLTAAPASAVGQTDAEQALRRFPNNSWYDRHSEQFVPPKIKPADDEPLRQTGRIAQAPTASPGTTWDSRWWDWFPSFPDLTWLAQWFPSLIFSALGAMLLVVIGILTYYALRNYMPQRFQRSKTTTAVSIDPARIVDLPFEVEAVDGHPLAQAERLMQAGNYDAAIVFLYGYLLLVLDQSRKIHLQKGKTNRMYLRELRREPALRDILQQAVLVFEACYFGKHPISRQDFLAIWQRVDEFHQLLQSSQPSSVVSMPQTEAHA